MLERVQEIWEKEPEREGTVESLALLANTMDPDMIEYIMKGIWYKMRWTNKAYLRTMEGLGWTMKTMTEKHERFLFEGEQAFLKVTLKKEMEKQVFFEKWHELMKGEDLKKELEEVTMTNMKYIQRSFYVHNIEGTKELLIEAFKQRKIMSKN